MRFYYVQDAVHSDYHGTLTEAHKAAKAEYGRLTVGIDEVEIDTDKESMLNLLRQGTPKHKVLRSWELTGRGGLKEAASSA